MKNKQAGTMPTSSPGNRLVAIASLFLFLAVAFGAFGAHALRERLEAAQRLGAWETAVLYQLMHGVALFAAGLFAGVTSPGRASRLFTIAMRFMIVGVILFSGSLYAICLGGPSWIGPVTPIGGVFLLAAWVLIGIWSLRPAPRATK